MRERVSEDDEDVVWFGLVRRQSLFIQIYLINNFVTAEKKNGDHSVTNGSTYGGIVSPQSVYSIKGLFLGALNQMFGNAGGTTGYSGSN